MPAAFSGSVADNASGAGLNANSTTFTLERVSDGKFWDGTQFKNGATILAATNSSTSGGASTGWTSNVTLPSWAAQSDGDYRVVATATDAAGNSFTGASSTFTLDNTAPGTASVTTPANGSAFRAPTVPASFSGSVADNAGGVGLNADSTTFTLQRPDGQYWTGSAWQVAVFNLAATNSATTGNTVATWTSNATMPTWASEADGTYTVRATATDKVGNTTTGAASTFSLDKTAPITASITAPANGATYNAAAVPGPSLAPLLTTQAALASTQIARRSRCSAARTACTGTAPRGRLAPSV